jgi:hypothetical protein
VELVEIEFTNGEFLRWHLLMDKLMDKNAGANGQAQRQQQTSGAAFERSFGLERSSMTALAQRVATACDSTARRIYQG